MEVIMISTETITPSFSSSSPKSTLHRDRPNPNPFKISLLDQVTPDTFFPFIFFFENAAGRSFPTRLKASLSHALSRFYPFAGAVENNLVVENYQNGVPFLEVRVSVKMATFLSGPKTASLNRLLPCLPFRKPDAPTRLLAVQLSEFLCGGVAVGVCVSHKVADATCLVEFLNHWASLTRPCEDRAPQNDMSLRLPLKTRGPYENENDDVLEDEVINDVSLRFPPVDPLPIFYTSIYENLWFSSGNFKTERFVFDAKALAHLVNLARTDQQHVDGTRPTRVQALSGFIWKSAMGASRSLDPRPRTVLACQAVNLRPKGVWRRRAGNEFWWSVAVHNDDAASAEERELPTITESLTLSVAETREYYSSLCRGEEAYAAIGDHFRLLEELYTVEDPEVYGFTSWANMGLDEVDFGLGRPVWAGTFGEVGPEFRNLVVLKDEAQRGGGLEAWLTLEEKVLTELRKDPEFLALASVDPPSYFCLE